MARSREQVRSRIDLGAGVTVDAIRDALADHPRQLEDAFGEPPGGWAAARAQYGETLGETGRWRLPVHVFLVRTPNVIVLVDAGVGSAGTVASRWLEIEGSLGDELAGLGVPPDRIDLVVFTHLHEDHVGWAADPVSAVPWFPQARYLVSAQDWEALNATERPRHVAEALAPAENAGRLDPIAPSTLADGIEAVALPGHTPGHLGVAVSGTAGKLLLVGDAFNHPVQVRHIDVPSGADRDRGPAIETRRRILDCADSGTYRALGSAHLSGGWWLPVRDGAHRVWRPID